MSEHVFESGRLCVVKSFFVNACISCRFEEYRTAGHCAAFVTCIERERNRSGRDARFNEYGIHMPLAVAYEGSEFGVFVCSSSLKNDAERTSCGSFCPYTEYVIGLSREGYRVGSIS